MASLKTQLLWESCVSNIPYKILSVQREYYEIAQTASVTNVAVQIISIRAWKTM